MTDELGGLPNQMPDEKLEAEEWLRSRPACVQALIRRFPPACKVRANRPLVCPAVGHDGFVVSYGEDGTVGVISPEGGLPLRAHCQADWLEVVECAEGFDHDYVRRVLGPPKEG